MAGKKKSQNTARKRPEFGEELWGWKQIRGVSGAARQLDLFAQVPRPGLPRLIVDLERLTPEERRVADLICGRRRGNPIPLKDIVKQTSLNDRAVALIVEQLIVTYGIKIGASRELPNSGYFLCVDQADVEAAVRPLRSTAESLRKRIEALTRA